MHLLPSSLKSRSVRKPLYLDASLQSKAFNALDSTPLKRFQRYAAHLAQACCTLRQAGCPADRNFWYDVCLRAPCPEIIPFDRLARFCTVTLIPTFPQARGIEFEILQSLFALLAVSRFAGAIKMPSELSTLASSHLDDTLGHDAASLARRQRLLDELKKELDAVL